MQILEKLLGPVGPVGTGGTLDVSGNVHLTGDIQRDIMGETIPHATPIAFASIVNPPDPARPGQYLDPEVQHGTPNVTCWYDQAGQAFHVGIEGVNAANDQLVTAATAGRYPQGGAGLISTEATSGGLLFRTFEYDGTTSRRDFQFVVFRLSE